MQKMNNNLPVKTCIRIFLHYLTRRRETVIRAMLELRPELVFYEHLQMIYNLDHLAEKVEEFGRKRDSGQIQLRGVWNRDWEYAFHGIGIRLTNRISREYYDWDIGRPDRFFLGEVELHLEWRCEVEINAPEIQWYRDWVRNSGGNFDSLLHFMKDNTLIVEVEPYVWTLSSEGLQLLSRG